MKNEDDQAHGHLVVNDRDAPSVDNGESLQTYMRAIQKLPLLKRDEEAALARTIRDGKTAIIELFCESVDFLTELFLIKELSITEQRKLFFTMLDEDSPKEKVAAKLAELEALITVSVKANKATPALVEFLKQMNFTPSDLTHWAGVIANFGSRAQLKKLQANLSSYKLAKDKMISSNLRLVFSRAKRFCNKGLSLEDLLQEGNIGLIKAIDKYDVDKGFKFGTYATWWIDQALGRSVADKGRLIRIPVHMVENINRLSKASRNLSAKLGRTPLIGELSAASDLSEEKIKKVNDIGTFPHSVEEPQGVGGIPLSEYLVDHETLNPFEVMERKEIADKVRFILSKLEPREEKILRMRFGIGEKKPQLLKSIGISNKISKERVRQILDKSFQKLDTYTKSKDYEDDWVEFNRRKKTPDKREL